jgi:signal transduction histidine kinase
MAWDKARRMNHTERASLPVLAEIAARTNGVIEQERKAMKEQLANSLKIEDYELIEAEYAHQWNKRIRAIRNNAKFALEDLKTSGQAALPGVVERLTVIEQKGSEALERLKFNSKVKESEELTLKTWLADVVKRWNMLNSDGGIECSFEATLSDEDKIRTRPIILNWILNELMTNAKEAEQRAHTKGQRIRVTAGFNAATREYEINICNPTPMPRATLQAVRSGTPLDRPNGSARGSGRGIWIASGQVAALLGGELRLPEMSDTETTFTVALRRQIVEG